MPCADVDTSPCPVPRWLAGGHAQTLYGALCAPHPRVAFVRERVDTPDGDFIDVDWSARPANGEASQALLLLHGLEGGSRSHYAQTLAGYLCARGWIVAVAHFRGCSDAPNRLARAYHSGDSTDVAFMLAHARARAPKAQWHALGVSLGGNALLKFLGEQGERAQWLAACAAISAPMDLLACGDTLSQTWAGRHLYSPYFLRSMRHKVREKVRRFPGVIDAKRLAHLKTLRDFDDAYTAPVHGYRDVRDYWTRASSLPWLRQIAVPTLILNARDDPFVPASSLPGVRDVSPTVLLHQPAQGGHVGFVTGRFPGHLYWMAQRVARFFADQR